MALLKASAFTGSPSYYETLYFLDDILIRTSPLRLQATDSTNTSQHIKYTWKSRQRLADALQFPLTALQFRRIRQRLGEISEVAHKVSEVRDFLRPFVAVESVSRVEENGEGGIVDEGIKRLAHVDGKGRVVAEGKRKEAKARVRVSQVVTAKTGSASNAVPVATHHQAIMVNHKPLSVYFPRMRDRVEVCKPFEITNTFGRYRLDCAVEGGGHTGMQ